MSYSYQIADTQVHSFPYALIDSRMYIIIEKQSALVIDPCENDAAHLLLAENKVNDCLIILTHEHYDHISGVNWLRQNYPSQVVCSKICSRNICDSRRNSASFFLDMFLMRTEHEYNKAVGIIDPEYACTADIVFDDHHLLEWQGHILIMDRVPGHSKGSVMITMDGVCVFTGDTLIPGEKTITRLYGGSTREYRQYAVPYINAMNKKLIVFPGHGKAAILEDVWK